MGCFSGAAVIAADEQFVSSAQNLLDQIRSLREVRVEMEKRLKRLGRRNDSLLRTLEESRMVISWTD
jgi:hypothetical protein